MKRTILLVITLFLLITTLWLMPTSASETEEKVVRVGWFDYPLSSEVRDGKFCGYTYDYLMEIVKYTDWKYEFVQADFATCYTMLKNGEIDIIGGLEITEEREHIFDFSDNPYSQTYLSMFTRINSSLKAYDYEHFNNISIGILKGSSNKINVHKLAEDNGFTCNIEEYDTNEQLYNAVISGEMDAGVLLSFMSTEETKIISRFSPISIHFVTTKGNKEVMAGINRGMTQIRINKNDFETVLYQKYYVDSDIVELSEEEQAVVNASLEMPIKVGVVDNGSPVSFWNNKTDSCDGLLVKIFDAICHKTGLNVQYVSVDLDYYEKNVTTDEDLPQIILGVPLVDGEDDTYKYKSDKLLEVPMSLIVQPEAHIDYNSEKLKIGIVKGFPTISSYIKRKFPYATIVEYSSLVDSMNAVVDDEVDGAAYYQNCINYYLKKPIFSSLKIVPINFTGTNLCAAGYLDSDKLLVRIIDKGIGRVSDSDLQAIMLNESMLNTYSLTVNDTLYKYRFPLIIIIALFVAVITILITLYFVKRNSSKKLSVAFKQKDEALIEAERASSAKGDFMSRMSHEIRTPLNAVIGYNTIARNEMTEARTDAERKQSEMKVMECLTKSDIASRHLLTIINDILDISAIASGKIKTVDERFDFSGLISSLSAIFYSQANVKGVDFEVIFDTQMDEWLIGDQMRVNQILTNLLANAIKFTPDGGKVTLHISPQIEKEKINVCFKVQDTGIGMSKEYMSRIWTPFEQADSSISRRFGGTGLGLSITKTLVDMLGGTIDVESKEGDGTTFIVNISFSRMEQPLNTSLYDFSSINALIVDDDVSTCDYIRLLLTRSGVHSTAVYSGFEAIAAVKKAIEEEQPYSLCLVDWRMPNMDGLDTIKEIREIAGFEIPIIVLTAYDFTEVVDKASEIGVNKFISKPLFQSSLFNLLTNICGCSNPVDNDKVFSYDFSGSRVLLAEDNAMNMEIAKHMLESVNLKVDNALNGQEAVDKFLSSSPGTYSAILMDVQMPVMDGYEATQRIRESLHKEAKTIPIIAMTADAFAENIAKSHSVGMDDHISKPIDFDGLYQTLSKLKKQ